MGTELKKDHAHLSTNDKNLNSEIETAPSPDASVRPEHSLPMIRISILRLKQTHFASTFTQFSYPPYQ